MARTNTTRMSQGRRNTTYTKRGSNRAYREESLYVQGNTVRNLDIKRAIEEEPRKRISETTRKNREKAFSMNLGYVIFLAGALCIAGVILISYLQLQSDITYSVKKISTLENQLNSMKISNDEEYSRIMSSVDLETVKKIAIEELGMKYAGEGQIVTYSSEGSDYVRQYTDLPESN